MTTSFADFVATQDARNDIQLRIREYTLMLCDALAQDFVAESIKRCKFFAAQSDNKEYFEQRVEKLKNGEGHYKFYIESGQHHKTDGDDDNSCSVHAFVDMKTGEVYKPASVKAPAKGVRFNLLIMKEREDILENCDWAGGYLMPRVDTLLTT